MSKQDRASGMELYAEELPAALAKARESVLQRSSVFAKIEAATFSTFTSASSYTCPASSVGTFSSAATLS